MNEVLVKLQSHVDSFGQLTNFDPQGSEYVDKENQLKESLGGLVDRLQQRISEQDTECKLSLFVKITQDRLTEFADKVFGYYQGVEIANTAWQIKLKNLYIDIQDEVIKVLEFLRINFCESFNFFAKVPLWVFYADQDLASKKSIVIARLENREVCENLVSIITNFLDKYQFANTLRFKDWHQWMYYKKLLAALYGFVGAEEVGDDTIRLIKLLIGYNFNPLVFYNFMVEYAEGIAGKDTPFEEQEIAFLSLLKTIGNVRAEVSRGYNPEVQPILESVTGSIMHELNVVAKMKEVQSPSIIKEPGQKKAWYYFEVSSTLEELLLFLKVMQAVRFVKSRYNANLYRFIERHIKTDRTRNANASTQYMRNVFAPSWEFSPKVVKKVRSWLTTMIAYIDSHFPEQLRILTAIWFLKVPADLFFSIA